MVVSKKTLWQAASHAATPHPTLLPTDLPKDTEMNGMRATQTALIIQIFISHILMNGLISNISYYYHVAQWGEWGF